MRIPQPTAAEERAAALRSRARAWERDGLVTVAQRTAIDQLMPNEWHRVGPILHIVFFVLALNVLGAIYGFCSIIGMPAAFTTGVLALVAGEMLIDIGKVFGAGVESALWIGGLCSLIFSLPSQGKVEAILVFALAFAVAGWRVLSPIFGGVAFALVAVYLAVKTETWWPSLLFCAIVTLAALVLLQRRVERRSTEWLLSVLVLTMPLTGYIAAHVDWFWHLRVPNVGLALALESIAAVLFSVGIARRGRVELVAGFVAFAAGAFELSQLIEAWYEAKLIVGGIFLVAFAWIVSRVLRGHERGFVLTRSTYSQYDDAMRIAATVALAPQHHAAPATPQRESGGGSFGGAGASGDF